MREIYAIAIDDDVPLPSEVGSDLRVIAYLVYDELNRFETHTLCADDDNLLNNYLLETYSQYERKYIYKFISDKSNEDYRMYEPIVINNTCFGLTVYKNSITEEDLRRILARVQQTLNLHYEFKIISEEYKDNKISSRFKAIENLTYRLKAKKAKKRTKTRGVFSSFRI